jgi:hypothetical protein
VTTADASALSTHDVAAALRGGDPDAALRALLDRADALRAQGALDRAAQSYDAFAQALCDRLEEVTSPLHRALLQRCAAALIACLDPEGTPRETRRRTLRALVDLLDADPAGDFASEVPDALRSRCLPEERTTVAGWLRALGGDEDVSSDDESETPWDRLRHAQLLFDLVVDDLPEAAFARACPLLHREAELCEHLLRFGRLDEALALARDTDPRRLPAVADVLTRFGHRDDAVRVLTARTLTTPDAGCLAWLAAPEGPQGDAEVWRARAEALLATGGFAEAREAATWAVKVLGAAPPGEGMAWLKSLRQRHIHHRTARMALDRAGLSAAQ